MFDRIRVWREKALEWQHSNGSKNERVGDSMCVCMSVLRREVNTAEVNWKCSSSEKCCKTQQKLNAIRMAQ